jgi:hypothetical protein
MAYVGLVIMGYTTEGSCYQFKFETRHPAYSTIRLLIAMGVRLATSIVRTAELMLTPLFEAAAHVGDWIAERNSPKTRARYRSRFI